MNLNDLDSLGLTRRQTLLAALSAVGLSACGGGGGDLASVGTGGTGSFSVGPITGIGSIIVNGVRYEDSSANISSDDSPFDRKNLRLGMVVAVQGTPTAGGRSTAARIVLGSELVGPISSIDIPNQLMEVLGQKVFVSPSTFYEGGSLDSLKVNDVIEVHGVADPVGNSVKATYVEKKNSVDEYRIQGLVTAHDGIGETFSIGILRLNYADTPMDRIRILPNKDALVRVRMGTVQTNGAYPVKRIRKPEDSFNGFSGEVELKGTITTFSNTSSFSVNDLPVTASGNAYPQNTAGIKAGAYVEVKGSLVGGVLVATRVKLEDGGPPGSVGSEFELHGTISNALTSVTGGSFTLTSSSEVAVEVDWTNSVPIPNGSAVNLKDGRRVEVKGTLAAGTRVTATRIQFEN